MVEFIKYTVEDIFYKCLKEDPRAAGNVLAADDNSTITAAATFKFSIPAKYAKYLLKEYIKNEIQTTK